MGSGLGDLGREGGCEVREGREGRREGVQEGEEVKEEAKEDEED